MKPGIYSCLTNEAYHHGPGESKSLLDKVRTSPAHYRAVTAPAANDEPPSIYKPTPAQEFGTAFHALLLEPAEFAKQYTLGLRKQDVEGPLVESREQLVAMVEELNLARKPKLATSGSKAELVDRIVNAMAEGGAKTADTLGLEELSLADLKARIGVLNESRPGLLPTTGNMDTLAQLLRDSGRQFTLWSEAKDEWARNNGHRTVLTPEAWDQLHRMRDAVMAHPAARSLLTKPGAVAERSVYWVDPTTGLLCRCRPDWWLMQDGILVDLKTCEDASAEGFARSIAKWRYHVQQAFYTDGVNLAREQMEADAFEDKPAAVRAFVFLAVEKSACVVDGEALGVAVYHLDSDSVELGRREYAQDLARINECKRVGRFPGYGNAVQAIELPRWTKAAAAAANDDAPNPSAA